MTCFLIGIIILSAFKFLSIYFFNLFVIFNFSLIHINYISNNTIDVIAKLGKTLINFILFFDIQPGIYPLF